MATHRAASLCHQETRGSEATHKQIAAVFERWL